MKIILIQKRFALVVALLIGSVSTALTAPPYYVSPTGNDAATNSGSITSPFASLERARQEVRKVNTSMSANIYVYLRSGTYTLSAPVNFSTADSGTNGYNVIYQAYNGETPVISGGTPITNWTSEGGGKYSANVGALRFRQLFVNGRRAVRARTPNAGYMNFPICMTSASHTITVTTSQVVALNGLTTAELGAVEMVLTRHWAQNRLRIGGVANNGVTTNLSFLEPDCYHAFRLDWPIQSYCLENSKNFLDAEDEWFLDAATNTLYYIPKSTEPIASSSIIAPTIESLIKLQGTSLDTPIHHIQFIGLTFAHTTWNMPSSEGYVERQAGIFYTGSGIDTTSMPSAVYVDKADSLRFEKNTFRQLGGQALAINSSSHFNTINGNTITDVSGNGISIDMLRAMNPSDARMVCSDNSVTNNYVSDCAVDYWGSVGIFGGYVKNTTISNNEIAYMPYTGISVGWGWTTSDSQMINNQIQYNHIHHVMDLMDDGAGIYTLSKQPNTSVSNNFIHNLRRSAWTGTYPISAIYLDQGSSCMTVSNNTCLEVEERVHENYASNNTLTNNGSLLASVVDQSGPQAAYLPSKIVPSLVAYWKMENATGTVTDSSGLNNHGTIVNGITSGAGVCGNALRFTGTNRITVPDSASLRVQRFTISAWIKPDSTLSGMTNIYPYLVSKQNWSGNSGYYVGSVNPSSNTLSCRVMTGSGTSYRKEVGYSEASTGCWIHVAATYDGAQVRIYRNGLLASVTSGVFSINADATALNIGLGFQGWMDEVRIYNEALPQEDIQTLADMNVDSSLVARWPLDDVHPSRLADMSGNNNIGCLTGTPNWIVDAYGLATLSFSGTAPGVTITDSAALRVQNYTIAVWIKPDVTFSTMTNAYPVLLSKQDWANNSGYMLGSLVSRSNTLGNRFMTGASTTNRKEVTYTETGCGGWIHVVGTYDGNKLSLYRNGVLMQESSVGSFTINHNATAVTIGTGFQGQMRDMRLYNRALSAAETLGIYTQTTITP